MPFIVEQVRKGRTYVYEASSYRDPKTGSPRQRRRYLGVKDPNSGEVRQTRGNVTPRHSLDFGGIWLTMRIADAIGLPAALEEALGAELGRRVMSLAAYAVSGGDALYLYKDWSERTWGVERDGMSSQDLSRLLSTLGALGRERGEFWRGWAKRHGQGRNLVFDVTSISSYGESVDSLEWGYNRDGESLPQINIGLMMAERNLQPLGYQVYPGSIPDIRMLVGLLEHFEEMGMTQSRLILDRGFFSAGNMKALSSRGYSFLIPMPFTSDAAKRMMSKNGRLLELPENAIEFNGRVLGHLRRKAEVAGVECDAHLFCDDKRRASEKENLMRKIIMVERELSGKRVKDMAEGESRVEALSPGCAKLLELSITKGLLDIRRNKERIAERVLRMGRMILLSGDKGLEGKEALRDYYRKEFLEKFFDAYKNEISQNRLRIHSEDAMSGRVFVAMVALCLHCAFAARLRGSELDGRMSIPEMMGKLKLIRVVEFSDGKLRRTEMTGAHRRIYEAMDAKLPPPEVERT